jgi:cystathionine beta-lyase/cystathionine gamma-synthase
MQSHSDLIAGTITGKDKKLGDAIGHMVRLLGNPLPAFDCFLLARGIVNVFMSLNKGIKTLDVRMERHNKNALFVAEFLEKHAKVSKVYYPGLASHPQYEIAKRQMRNSGGMLSFEVIGNEII